MKKPDLRMRLWRYGVANNPKYRIAVMSCKTKRDGKFLEHVGTYDPIPDKHNMKYMLLNVDRIKMWLGKGVYPTDTVKKILSKAGLIPSFPRGRIFNQDNLMHASEFQPNEKVSETQSSKD